MARKPANEPGDEDGSPARTEQITIAGQTFTVPAPFAEGHVLTAGQASQLNQVFHENIRNNKSKVVKAGQKSHEELQAEIDEYAAKYEFGVRTGGGGRTSDPVRREALRLARNAIESAIRKKGEKVGGKDGYSSADITARAKELVDSRPQFMEQARRNVEASSGLEVEV